jgi:hypothetical protein
MGTQDASLPNPPRLVLYQLTVEDIRQIEHQRRARNGAGELIHRGNAVAPGQVFPMLIVRLWGLPHGSRTIDPDTPVNGQVWLDGTDTHWVQKVVHGNEAGQFTWPAR